jgi:hypothetical protein
MATRTSTRSTKAVKFVDSAESDEDDEDLNKSSSIRIKSEGKKPRGRPPNVRRNQPNDDEEWDVRGEQIPEDDDDSPAEEASGNERDVTKKFKTNQSTDSVYDFG